MSQNPIEKDSASSPEASSSDREKEEAVFKDAFKEKITDLASTGITLPSVVNSNMLLTKDVSPDQNVIVETSIPVKEMETVAQKPGSRITRSATQGAKGDFLSISATGFDKSSLTVTFHDGQKAVGVVCIGEEGEEQNISVQVPSGAKTGTVEFKDKHGSDSWHFTVL